MVSNALRQGRFRTDNGEVNLIFFGCPDQRLYISRANIQILGNLSRAGVPWSSVYFFDLAALGELPDQRMLPPPTANNQYFYLTYPLSFL